MPATASRVLFRVTARDVPRRAIQQFANSIETEIAGGRPFTCLITGDQELRRLNRTFRKKDRPTDVLSFPAPGGRPELGDIAISYQRARQQAQQLAHSTAEELRILMLHGALHLTGLDHDRDRGQMAAAERRWRKRFGLPSGLIERARP